MERREDRGRMPVGRFLVALGAIVAFLSVSAGGAGAFNPDDLKKLEATVTHECPNCDLSQAWLSGYNLNYAVLYHANLRGALLGDAYLNYANMIGADLTGADLSNAGLYGANLSGATWIDGSHCKEGSIGECKK